MSVKDFARRYLNGLTGLFDGFDVDCFERIVEQILDAYAAEKRIFVMGNGGSGATASHFTVDINKGCCFDLNKKFKMLCLNDNIPTLLALSNDVNYEAVFVEQLKNFFEPGDLVIGISGSGNSKNVLNAIQYANENGGQTIGLSGFFGGNLSKLAHISFIAQVDDMQKVGAMHLIILHMIMQAVDSALHGSQN